MHIYTRHLEGEAENRGHSFKNQTEIPAALLATARYQTNLVD